MKAKVQYRVVYQQVTATGVTEGCTFVNGADENEARGEFTRLHPGALIVSLDTEADREFKPLKGGSR